MPSQVHNGYEIREGDNHIDWIRVHRWLTSSYWSPGISREEVKRAGRHSALLLSAFKNGQQVAYLRVISDKTRFAYLCDIWVDSVHRRKGLAQAMVRYALGHPEFSNVAWLLATTDAHAVYAPLGFNSLEEPQHFMRRKPTPPDHEMGGDSSF